MNPGTEEGISSPGYSFNEALCPDSIGWEYGKSTMLDREDYASLKDSTNEEFRGQEDAVRDIKVVFCASQSTIHFCLLLRLTPSFYRA